MLRALSIASPRPLRLPPPAVAAAAACARSLSTPPAGPECHYNVLGVARTASAADIKAAFRARAKEWHPDLRPGAATEADRANFLRLVTAYELLSDAQRRAAYDVSTDAAAPAALRRAAASHESRAAAAAAAAAGESADAFAWRYGLGDWARHGPVSQQALGDGSSSNSSGGLQRVLAGALARHAHNVEAHLHAGLMRAFLGPPLATRRGELPPAFEADERQPASPPLTDDLLHLVHGRQLLGVVRVQAPLKLTGGSEAAPALSDGQQVQPTVLSGTAGGTQKAAGMHSAISSGSSCHEHDERAAAPADAATSGGSAAVQAQQQQQQQAVPDAAAAADASDGDECISEAEWQELLQQQHPLRGWYNWAPAAPQSEPAAGDSMRQLPLASVDEQAAACSDIRAAGAGSMAADSCGDAAGAQQDAHDEAELQWLGGRQAWLAWQQGRGAEGSDAASAAVRDLVAQAAAASGGQLPTPLQQQRPPQQAASSIGRQQQQQKEPQQHRSPQEQHRQHKAAAQAAWLRRRRLRRWLRAPTADWEAADWSFDDVSDGVLVLQLLLDSQVVAVAVRDEQQPAKPIKVYLHGTFIAALLDDVVMEPMTGQLAAVLYKFYTPGVHHVMCLRPAKPSSRVLARMQRRWMPPSSTWLFPPRSDSHDVGGWLVEWEGHKHAQRPGWLHPAVYVLAAASYSFDMEQRVLRSSSAARAAAALWQQVASLFRAGCGRLQSWRVRVQRQQQAAE